MRRFVGIGIAVLIAGLCIGIFFGAQSLGNNPGDGDVQATAAASPDYAGYAVMSLLIGGGTIFLIRPRRKVVSTKDQRIS